jgi:uncharacterized protein YjbI with pentapeptide repeats
MGFINTDLSNAALTNMGSSAGSNLFSNVNLSGAKFAGSSFNNTSIAITALSQANLSGMVKQANHAIFNTDLSGVDFSGFSFSQTVFDGSSAQLRTVQGSPWANASSVKGANFSGASFSGVMFSNLDLSGANFSGAAFSQVYAQTDKSGTLTGVAGVATGNRVNTSTAVAIFGSYIAGSAPADGMEYLGFNSGPSAPGQNNSNPRASSHVSTSSAAQTGQDQAAAQALKTLTAIIEQLTAAKKAAATKDGSASGKFMSATPTDAVSAALTTLQQG